MTGRRLRLGYLHLGSPRNGLCRYGHVLAGEARRQHADVIESEVELTRRWRRDRDALASAGRRLAGADVIHFQYSDLARQSTWASGWRRVSYLWSFVAEVVKPLVATVHDMYPLDASGRQRRAASDTIALRLLARLSAVLLVSSEEERRRLLARAPRARVELAPHFVEERTVPDATAAKQALGLSGARVVTLLGFIHERKGYRVLLDAVSKLPADVVVVLAGQPVDEAGREVREAAARHGCRVRVTGYLPDAELAKYLAATDLAVCPFLHMSASGSLATWLSARRPILASDLPQVAEYNGLAPHAIATFSPYTSAALATRICELLERPANSEFGVARLAAAMGLPRVFERHMNVYATCAAQDRSRVRPSLAAITQ